MRRGEVVSSPGGAAAARLLAARAVAEDPFLLSADEFIK
jgi:hypothetical protein